MAGELSILPIPPFTDSAGRIPEVLYYLSDDNLRRDRFFQDRKGAVNGANAHPNIYGDLATISPTIISINNVFFFF